MMLQVGQKPFVVCVNGGQRIIQLSDKNLFPRLRKLKFFLAK